MTLTLKGWSSTTKLKGVTVNVKNNASSGAGTATVKVGTTEVGSLSITGLGSTYQEKSIAITETALTGDLSIVISCSTNSAYCNKFVVTYEEAPAYTIIAASNNTDYGTVSLDGTTITASPADGYRVSTSNPYTVSPDGSATVSQSGNVFTVTPSANTAVTINFEAIPTYTVTVGSITGGSLTLKDSEDNTVASGSSVREGTVLTIVPAASENYKFASWSDGTNTYYTDVFTYTVTEAVTFTATFNPVVTHKVYWHVNGNVTTENVAEDDDVVFPSDPADSNGKKFQGWATAAIDGTTDDKPAFVTEAKMGTTDLNYYAVFATVSEGDATTVTDELNRDVTGVTGTSYTDWSDKTVTSNAVYAGNSAGGNTSIQLNNGSPKGIVSTTSGGSVKKVVLEWNSNTTSGRTLDVYGSNTAYTAASNLYSTSTQGTKLGSIVYGTSTELTVTGDYKYVGLVSNSGALYLTKVSITWENKGDDVISAYCTDTRVAAPISYAVTSVDKLVSDDNFTNELTNAQGLTVTYSSSDPTVATVNASTGEVDILKVGTTTITATYAETSDYLANTASYTLNVTAKAVAGLAYASTAVEKLTTDDAFTNALTNPNTLTVTYSSSDTDVATVNASTGEVTIVGAGTTTITASSAETSTYEAGEVTYTLTVSKATPTLTFASATATGREGQAFAGNALTTTPADLPVTYTSSDTDVATVNSSTGAVTIKSEGETTITASFAGNDTYAAAEASYTLTVSGPAYTFAKVTDASSLRAGDRLIIVNEEESKAMKLYDSSRNNFQSEDVTIENSQTSVELDGNVQVLTLTGEAGAWHFSLGSSCLAATGGTSSNYLKAVEENTTTTQATISIENGNAEIKFNVTGRNWLRYNSSGGSIFSCYGSGQKDVQLYRMSEFVTLPAGIYATRSYGRALNFSGTDVTAYTVKVDTEKGTAKLTEIADGKVPAGAGVILYAESAGTYAVPVAENVSALSDNDLVGVTEETTVPWTSDGGYNYILQRSGSDYAFNKATGAMLAANRAYLHTSYDVTASGSARLVLVFDDDDSSTTAVSRIRETAAEGKVYNLRGQRVENPKKGGLYIVDGRKMVIK